MEPVTAMNGRTVDMMNLGGTIHDHYQCHWCAT